MGEINYRDTLLFYPSKDDENRKLCEISDLSYKPLLLIQHHYPNQKIVDICKKNEKEIYFTIYLRGTLERKEKQHKHLSDIFHLIF